jgi:hypothetical protein
MAGATESFGAGGRDAWVLKLNSAGTVVWQKAYGGSGWDGAYYIQQTSDGGYVVAGVTDSFGAGYGDLWILKLNTLGTVQWQKTYGSGGWDGAYSIQTSGGGYVVAGYGASVGVIKLDANGEVPNCDAMGTSGAAVSDTLAVVGDTSIIPQTSSAVFVVTNVSSQDTSLQMTTLCSNRPPTANAGDPVITFSESQSSIVIQGTADDPDIQPLSYRWLEGENEISAWQAVGGNGEAHLDLSALPTFSVGDHTLTLDVSDGELNATDDMIMTLYATGVGGIAIPVDKVELMASWITLRIMLLIGFGLVGLAAFRKSFKKQIQFLLSKKP